MSIRNVARSLAAVVLVGAGFVGTAQASTIAIVPGSQTIAPGATTGVDIVLTGLSPTETVGAFSIVLTFNDTILDGVGFVNDPGNKMGAGARDCLLGPCDLSAGFTAVSNSPLDLFYAADLVTPEATLHALQTGAPFVLAHVDFKGLVEGLSPLTLGFQPALGTFLSDFAGNPISPTSITKINGSICVDDPQTPGDRCGAQATVPEPATLSLLGAGLAAAAARRRRKASKA
jgi:PEP-CTERM motif